MKKWAAPALLLCIAALFLILNRGAYKGFFTDDELDNIITARGVHASEWIGSLASPIFNPANFRPVGHFYFLAMNNLAGLNFQSYVGVVHLLHILNLIVLWVLLRHLKLGVYPAAAGVAFFALNVAAFDAYWKPMYIFDVVCTTWCLVSLLLYIHARWVPSLLAMWLAYKSKELAVMLPLVLAAYEFWFGERKWKRLIPFFAISLLFGTQSLLSNVGRKNPYAFIFTPGTFFGTLQFYSSRVLLLPFAGLAFLLAVFITRDRRLWLGAAMLAAFFLPLLFLPGRMYPAYCYLPLTGAAVEIGVAAALIAPWRTAIFFLLWLPWNIRELRIDRRATLANADEARAYVMGIQDFARNNPEPPIFAFSQLPTGFHRWGLEAAVKYPYKNHPVGLVFLEDGQIRHVSPDRRVTILNWDWQRKKLFTMTRDPAVGDASYLQMNAETPVWQLGKGWYGLDAYFRWIEPYAEANLTRPAGAKHFELNVNMGPLLIEKYGHSTVQVILDDEPLAARQFDTAGLHTAVWDIAERPAGPAHVEFRVTPEARFGSDPRALGIAVVSFGFKP